MTIRTRVRLVAVIGFISILAFELASVSTIRELATVPERLQRHAFATGLAISRIEQNLRLLDVELSGLASAPTALRARSFERRTAVAELEIEAKLAIVEEGLVGPATALRETRAVMKEWTRIRDRIFETVGAGDWVATYTLAKTDGAGQIALALEAVARLHSQVQRDAALMRAETANAHEVAVVRLVLILTLAALALVLILRFMTRTVIAPTSEISASIRRIAEGELTVAIPHTDRLDEIGDIARSAEVFLQHAIAIRKAQFDVLTGLPMRDHLREQLQVIRVNPEIDDSRAALLHFDMDRFGELNDGLGREIGDAVLLRVANLLLARTRPGDLLVRESADSFVLLALNREGLDELESLGRSICDAVAAPITVAEQTVNVTCSVGITTCDPETSIEDLLLQAENALLQGRKSALGQVQVYTPEMDARLRRRRKTLLGLKQALDHDEIEPYFQPQVRTTNGEVTGFEALVRWNHPEMGLLAPWQFMDVATEAGLLASVTDTMIAKSARQLAIWRRRGLDVPRVSLNFAASDLSRPDFVDRLLLAVEREGLSPADICVELLETAMIEDAGDPVNKALERLEKLGFPIELDDFGTGHAAISTLHMVKLSGLKIDRGFITHLHDRPEQQHLTHGILRITSALNISTVAEGVENEEERALLIEYGCEVIQGFYIAPPMNSADATEWLDTWRPETLLAEQRAAS